ncbi:MAG: ABC transporter ATP-binding protein [Thermodesulfobacteriota bacterium]
MLEVENLRAFYGQFQALHDVSLRVDDGRLVAVFGPNGHGKSTLLKTICGLLRPTAGRVIFDGADLTRQPPEKIVQSGVVYIAEDRHLFPEMSVLDNLRLGAYNVNARRGQDERLAYVFQMFPQLAALRKKPAATLSGGEARMLAIGRGLMSNARFLAVDEPSLGLSPKLRSEVFDKIREIKAAGLSVLLVEQSTPEVADMADYLYLMEDGRMVFSGDKDHALRDEAIRRVFLGVA